jgi:hypothetical protein
MSSNLIHVGDQATREMAEHGEAPGPVFDQAAADATRAAGLSNADIVELFGYLPMPLPATAK